MSFDNLFEPIRIGKMELRNRIVMPALNTKFGTEWGAVNDRMIDYFVERAKGGVGLIVIEQTCVDWPVGKAGTNPIRADEWKFVQGLHDLAEAVHLHGAKIATQLQHPGRQGSALTSAEGQQLVAPSEIPCLPTGAEMPHALTIEEIEMLIRSFSPLKTSRGYFSYKSVDGHVTVEGNARSPQARRVLIDNIPHIRGVVSCDSTKLVDDEMVRIAVGELLPPGVLASVHYGAVGLTGDLPEGASAETIMGAVSKVPGVRRVGAEFDTVEGTETPQKIEPNGSGVSSS